MKIGFFAILVILPTAFMGMYGAVLYPEASTSEFLNKTFISDQSNTIGAIVMIGLVAAAISTSNQASNWASSLQSSAISGRV